MTAVLDRLLWFERSEIEFDRVREDLTVWTQPYRGEPKRLEFWEENDSRVGVPRAYGFKLLRSDDVRLDLACPALRWPDLVFEKGGGFWPGQEDASSKIVHVLTRGQPHACLCEAACGTGKTLIALSVARRSRVPTLVFVHKTDLAEQWRETLRKHFPDADYGHVQQDKWDWEEKHLVTATAQTLYSRRDAIPAGFWRAFGLVVWDEAHVFPAETFSYCFSQPFAKYRLGLSATFRRQDGLDCVWDWHIGDNVCKVEATRLTGTYAQPTRETRLKDAWFKWGDKFNSARFLNAVAKDVGHSEWLAGACDELAKEGRRVLLVSDRLRQLREVRDRLKGVCSTGMYVGGGDLEKARLADVVLATYQKGGIGTDIPELDTLVLGTPRADVEQVVGRIQRPCAGKRELLVVDPVFKTGYCRALAAKRRRIYDRLGFKKKEDAR